MTSAVSHDYAYLPMPSDPNDQPPLSGQMSWDDFNTFYSHANDWDYPLQDKDNTFTNNDDNNWDFNNQPDQHKNGLLPNVNDNITTQNQSDHGDIFTNHGSRQSVDNLVDDMNDKWSFNANNTNMSIDNPTINNDPSTDLLPSSSTEFTPRTLSNTAQASNRNVLNANFSFTSTPSKSQSITDCHGIDVSDDLLNVNKKRKSISTDEQIIKLKNYIATLEDDNKQLKEDNTKLKLRNGELRKQLKKAQEYRRRSSVAFFQIKKANDVIQDAQQQKLKNQEQQTKLIQNNKDDDDDNSDIDLILSQEEKVFENMLQTATDEEINKIIQNQIAKAIALFQEEFGAELDEEMKNIESFQYHSLGSDEDIDESDIDNDSDNDINTNNNDNNVDDDDPFIWKNNDNNQSNIANNNQNPNNASFHFGDFQNIDFNVKFTDAHSNPHTPAPIDNDNDDDDDDDCVLPASHTTPGGGPLPPPSAAATAAASNNNKTASNISGVNNNNNKISDLETRLNNLSDKIIEYMEKVEDLTKTNQQLELSKVDLVKSTSFAMNQYRDTIKTLNKQNNMLLDHIKHNC